jgi:hypothetical protein
MKKLKLTGFLLGMLLGVTGPAGASTIDYAFTISGPGFTGAADFAVDSASNIVQGMTFNGTAIQVVAPNGSGLFTQPGTGLQWSYDDRFFAGGTPFDNAGLLLSMGGNIANIYSVGTQLFLSLSNPISEFSPGEKISLTVAQTPLPPGLPLFLTAMVGLWFLLGRKKKVSNQSVALQGLGTV